MTASHHLPIDIAIPVAEKDYEKLAISLPAILAHSKNPIRRVYIIARNDGYRACLPASVAQQTVLIDEAHFPFGKNDIAELLREKGSAHGHASWYYQQLLKFYVFTVIPDPAAHILILDADFAFCQPVEFIDPQGRMVLAHGYPFKWLLNTRDYPETVEHVHAEFAKKFVPGWQAGNPFSGMQHHMLFEKNIMQDLFDRVEAHHQLPFWRAFIALVEVEKWNAAAEYVIYYHAARQHYAAHLSTRHLNACDIIHDQSENNAWALEKWRALIASGQFAAVGCHGFVDLRSRIPGMDYIPIDLKQDMLAQVELVFLLQLEDGLLRLGNQ